jgi:hypothetical protein
MYLRAAKALRSAHGGYESSFPFLSSLSLPDELLLAPDPSTIIHSLTWHASAHGDLLNQMTALLESNQDDANASRHADALAVAALITARLSVRASPDAGIALGSAPYPRSLRRQIDRS